MERKLVIAFIFTLAVVFCHGQEINTQRKNQLFIESQGLVPGGLAFGYERVVHLDRWIRYSIRAGLGPNADFNLYGMAGNSISIGRKVSGEIGLNYIHNFIATGLFAPGSTVESGLQPIIGVRIGNLNIPMSFLIFYEIPRGGLHYLTGCGVSVGYFF